MEQPGVAVTVGAVALGGWCEVGDTDGAGRGQGGQCQPGTPAALAPCHGPCRGTAGDSKGGVGNSPSHTPEDGSKRGHTGLAVLAWAVPLCEPQEKGSGWLGLFAAEGNELKTMSSSVNIYQMNGSRV